MKLLHDHIVAIQEAVTPEEAFRHFNEAMQSYGYANNVYALISDHPSIGLRGRNGVATTYPEDWLAHYNARNYSRNDPVWQRLLRSSAPFFWGDEVALLKSDRTIPPDQLKLALQIMNEGADAGVADGIGIGWSSPLGEIAALGLSRTHAEAGRSYEDLADIYLLATTFHEKFIGTFERLDLPQLSGREREVLLWAAENKSDYEISVILNLSHPTIRFHWKAIFLKLGVNGRLAAVVKALRLRLISPDVIRSHYQP